MIRKILKRAKIISVVLIAAPLLFGLWPAKDTLAGIDLPGGIFPLGDKVPVKKIKEEYVPFKGSGEITQRPHLFIEAGDFFLDSGKLYEGFEVPILGAVWQPRLWSYMISRTAVQSFDNHAPGTERETELANRTDLYVNLQLTGTEKILLGLRPFDNNRPDRFTRYTFDGASDGTTNELNVDAETLFFEGDLGSLIPNLDHRGITLLDFGFSVGRQPITFQEGILINDTIDSIGFVRNNLVFPGTSNLRIHGMAAWNRLDRNDRFRGVESNMFALFGFADTPVSTFNLDTIYVDDNGRGDAFYVGASAIQRLRGLGGISSAFRINSSFALEDEIGGNVIGDGILLTAELSSLVVESEDIVYFNTYAGIDNYTQAGREAIVGGPLANTGILYASPNLSTHGAEINPFTDDVIGFALGYQAFYDNTRRNIIFEISGRKDTNGGETDALGVGFQLQQAVGRYVQITAESFYTIQSSENDDSGMRLELQVVY